MLSRTFLVVRSFTKTPCIFKSCRTLSAPVCLCNQPRPCLLFSTASSEKRLYSKNHPMPKKDKPGKGQAAVTKTGTDPSGAVSKDKNGSVIIAVHAKPGSKLSTITDVSAEAVGVAIAAPPTDGEANTELIRFLSEVLGLKKSQITLDRGSRSRDKVIKLDSSLTPEEVLLRFKQAIS